MRALIGRSRLAILTIAAGILITISGCSSVSSPLEPDNQQPSLSGYITIVG
jgi:uncharacterized protein YceK